MSHNMLHQISPERCTSLPALVMMGLRGMPGCSEAVLVSMSLKVSGSTFRFVV